MITQKKIAHSLGISQPAVGAVLGNYSNKSKISVSPELKKQILQRAQELGYRPNMFAQGMRGLNTGIIGIIHFTSFLQSAIQRDIHMAKAIAAKGHRWITASAIASPEAEKSFYKLLVDQMIDVRVDGVVLSSIPGIMPREEIQRLFDQGIPCVSLSGVPFQDVPFITANFEQGMQVLTEHVIRQGYRRPAMIVQERSADPRYPNKYSITPRLKGFTAAIEAQGGEVIFVNEPDNAELIHQIRDPRRSDPSLRGYVFSAAGSRDLNDTYEVGYRAFNKLLDLGLAADVVMMPNDDWLQGALRAAKQRCLKVPEQIGLTGFDATPYGQFGTTPFTSVAQPSEEMAQAAVDTLFALIGGEEALQPETRLACSLVPGETTIARL